MSKYPTGCRKVLTAVALKLTGDTAQAVNNVELVVADPGSTHEPTACYTPASIRCWACNVVPDGSMRRPNRRLERCSSGAWAAGDDQRKLGSELFIVDNSDADW